MRYIKDLILLLLWGIACSGIIIGMISGDRFVFGVLGITSKPQGFPEYTVLSVSVILTIMLIMYHIVSRMKGHKVRTEISPVIMKDMPFEPVVFKASDDLFLTYPIMFVLFAVSLLSLYRVVFPLDPLFGGKFALDMNDLFAARKYCLNLAAFTMSFGFAALKLHGKKYYVLKDGFRPKSLGDVPRYYPIQIPWNAVEKVSIHAVPRIFNIFGCKIVFYGKPPAYFKELEVSHQQLCYNFVYIRRSDMEKAKDAISRRVPVEYTEEI